MKKVPLKKIVVLVTLGLILFMSKGMAQVDKGVTSTGKEVDCSTIDPSVDKTVSEHGKIVTHPRVTRNGKLITTECPTCGVDLSIADTVNCVSITLNATITDGDPTSAVLKVYSDAAHTTQVGSNIAASISGGKISAVAANLNCHTRYYFLLEITEGTETCTFDWTDSTRDMTMEKVTTCAVASVSLFEHAYEGTTDQIDSVYDHEGNAYAVVQIGDQCWLRQNMRCTTSPRQSSVNLTQGAATNDLDFLNAKYYDRTDASMYTINERGYLYNWAAAMDTTFSNSSQLPKNTDFPNHRGICPSGWHLPTVTEWNTMEKEYLTESDGITPISDAALTAANTYDPVLGIPNPRGKGSGKLTASCGWIEDNEHQTAPGNYSYPDRNISGFSALPIGCMGVEDGVHEEFYYLGESSDFWTATSYDQYSTWARFMLNNTEGIHHNNLNGNKNYGFAVRCVRDLHLIPEMSVCEDTTFGTVTLKEIQNAEKIEFVQGSTVVKTISNPASEIFVNDLAEGSYKIKATSSTEDTVVEDVRVKHTYTFCTVGALRANEMGATTTQLDSVKDHQNNWYEVVQIGNQCWLKENMRATTTPGGTNILLGGLDQFVQNNHSKAAFNHSNSVYGVMYNWCAAVDTFNNNGSRSEVAAGAETGSWTCNLPAGNRRGICPEGWHIPSDGEFWELENNTLTGLTPEDSATKNYGTARSGIGAGNLAAGCEWYPDNKATSPGNYSYTERNLSGFSARPAGTIEDGSQYANLTLAAYFWSSTPYLTTGAFARVVRTNNECTQRGSNHRYNAFSVRCVRDVIIPEMSVCEDTTFGTVTLKEIQNVEKIEFVQGSTVVKTISNPASEIFVNDLAEGNYKVKVTSSTGDTLVDNAYVKHTYTHCTVGQVRVNEMGNNTRLDSVRDHQNNWYEVVQIGNQCWLKQNMRATTKPDGTNILQYPTTGQSTTVPYAYYYNDNSANVRSYGLLYNWAAAMNGAASSAANPSGVRGICPEGWHLPSNAEYATLMNEVGVTQQSSASGTTGNSGRLVTGCNWNTYDNATSPGNYSYTERNLSGFSAVPSGNYNGGTTFQFEGERTFLWTATASNTELAYYRVIAYDFPVTTYTTNTKYSGRSVRCVRDMEIVPTLSICEDNFFGEIKLTEVENAVRVEVLNSGNAVVNTINNPVSGAVLTGLASDTYTVRAISTSGNFAAETADLVKEYTHCTVTSLRENEMGATTTQLDSVKDHQNNWYEVVEIDGKCWLRENMRCTTSPNGRLNVAPSKYWGPNNYYTAPGTAPVYKYGYLYNWSGALDVQETNPASISSLPQNTRGICPEGWHIPVIDEWTALRNALVGESTSEASYSGNTAYAVNTQIATILADGCDWLSDASANNKPGDYGNSNRNSSKFNWRPSPNYYGSNGNASCNTEGRSGYYWSASPNPANPSYAYMVYLHYTQTGIISGPDNKSHGRNVRCVRNN